MQWPLQQVRFVPGTDVQDVNRYGTNDDLQARSIFSKDHQ
jgi:hypothetical protein